MVKLYMHSYWSYNVNKFGVELRRGANNKGEEAQNIKIPSKDMTAENSLSLFNMINCEIVKRDGINKQENDSEQKKNIFYVLLRRLEEENSRRVSVFVDIWLIVPTTLSIVNH